MTKRFVFKDEYLFFMLVLPSLCGLLGFYVLPFILSLYFAVIENSVTWNFVGMKNFKEVITNGAFKLAIKNTGIFMSLCVPLNMVLPLCMALLLKNIKKYKNVFGVIFLIPLVIPSGSIIYFWQSIFSINGFINGAFFVNAPINWTNTNYARAIIIFIFIWKNAGYNMILFLAGLNLIPKDYYECAAIEGAGALKRFFSVTLIYLIPTAFLVLIMSIINSFKSFKEIYLLTGNYPHSSIYMIQHYMNNQFAVSNYQKLACASYILSVVIIMTVAVIFYMQNKIGKNF